MKFKCRKCQNELDLHKVTLIFENDELICKKAICCEQYMSQIRSEEYKGLPKIKRDPNDTNHSRSYDSDKLWKDAKKALASGEQFEKNKNK